MNDTIEKLMNGFTTLTSNTKLQLGLELRGWSATVGLLVLAGCGTACYVCKEYLEYQKYIENKKQRFYPVED